MSKAPPRIIAGLLRYHFNPSRNPINPNLLSKLPLTRTLTSPNSGFRSSITLPKFAANGFSTSKLNSAASFGRFPLIKLGSPVSKLGNVSCTKLEFNPLGIRCFSIRSSGIGSKIGAATARRVMQKPGSRTMVTSSLSRNTEDVSLQTEGFLKRNYLLLLGSGAAVFVCIHGILLSTIMLQTADAHGELSKAMAVTVLALSTIPIVAFAEMLYFGASLALICCLVFVLALVETF